MAVGEHELEKPWVEGWTFLSFFFQTIKDKHRNIRLTFTFITATSWRFLHQRIAVINSRAAVLFALNKSILKRFGSTNLISLEAIHATRVIDRARPVRLTLTLQRQTAEGTGCCGFWILMFAEITQISLHVKSIPRAPPTRETHRGVSIACQ
jgi:hypothetical protein